MYALQEMQPGLEKVYFTLQEELLKPQVQVKYQAEPIDNLIRRRVLPAGQAADRRGAADGGEGAAAGTLGGGPGSGAAERFEAQVQQVGWALYRFAWNSDGFMKYDKKAEKWSFVPDLTQALTKAGYLNPQMLQDRWAAS